MKRAIYILALLQCCNSYCQKMDSFEFQNNKLQYSILSNSGKNVIQYFVIVTKTSLDAKEIKKLTYCHTDDYSRIYILKVPNLLQSNELKQQLFLEFISEITSKTKLLESKLYVIADEDYTRLYRNTVEKYNHQYKYSYLNDIENLYYITSFKEICKIINLE